MAKTELIARENNIAHLVIELDPSEVDRHFKQVFKEYASQLKVPGFRKGKIPPHIIRNYVGKDNISSAASEALKDYAVDTALAQLKLTPRQGRINWHAEPVPVEAESLRYEFSIPVLPEVALPDYRAFELSVPVLGITPEMQLRYRERLQEKYTQYPEKEEAAGAQDALTISFSSVFEDSGQATPLTHSGLMYVLNREGNMPGWDEKLIGGRSGDVLDFPYTVPENFADKRVAGKALKLHIEVKSVHDVQVPVVNEQFIKDTLHMESMEQFEEYLQLSLERERDAQVEQMKRELAMQKMTAELTADITDDMLNQEIDGLVKDNDRTLRQYDSSLGQYLQEKQQSLQDYRDSLAESAMRKIKFFLAVKTIADAEGIYATSDDFQRYASYLMQYEGIPPEQMRELMQHREFYTEAAYQIVREKVLDHIVQSINFNPQPLSAAPDQEATDAESSEGES